MRPVMMLFLLSITNSFREGSIQLLYVLTCALVRSVKTWRNLIWGIVFSANTASVTDIFEIIVKMVYTVHFTVYMHP